MKSQYSQVEASLNARQHASNNMDLFLTQSVRDLTSRNTIDFNDIINKPTIIYIGISTDDGGGEGASASKENDAKISQLASLFCSSLYNFVENYLSKKKDS